MPDPGMATAGAPQPPFGKEFIMQSKSISLFVIAGLGLIMAAAVQASPAGHAASGEHRMQMQGQQMQQHGTQMQGKMQGRMQGRHGGDQVASATPSGPGAGHQHGMRSAEKHGQGEAHQHGGQGKQGAHAGHRGQGNTPAQP
jgi:hypothetical protein